VSELPPGWTQFSISDVGGTVGGKTPSKAVSRYWTPPEIPWASLKDMKVFLLKRTEDRIAHVATAEAGINLIPAGSVLMVTRSGILAHTFPVAIARVPMTINQDIKAILPNRLTDERYLAYALRAHEREILHSCSKEGTTVASVETPLLERLPLPLAPLAEQKRIADKLDALLARVDACRERLDRVPGILKRFRQSVLAAATSGELTRGWREERGLDEGWDELPLEEIIEGKPRNGYSPKAVEHATPVKSLTLAATTTGRFRGEHFKYIDEQIPADSHLWLRPGDVLIQRANTLEYVGVSAIFDGPENTFIYPDLMMKCRANKRVLPAYLHLVLSSQPVRKYFRENATGTAGNMPKINQRTVMAAPAVVPSVEEQAQVVARTTELLGKADALERAHTVALAKVTKLTLSALGKAFRGELVPQDSNDEPATAVLARLRTAGSVTP